MIENSLGKVWHFDGTRPVHAGIWNLLAGKTEFNNSDGIASSRLTASSSSAVGLK